MIKFLLLIFILISVNCFAQEGESGRRIHGSKELPLELNLLIATLQDSNIPKEEINSTILKIDSYARFLSKEDIFLVGKIEIYKTLLKSNEIRPRAVVDGESLKTLKESLKKAKDSFVKWFIQALLNDCESLISSPLYKEYVLQKNNGRLEKIEHKKIDKKVQLLSRWISKLNPDSADFENVFKAELAPVLRESLKNIEQSFFLLVQSSVGTKIQVLTSLKELKFFSVAERPKIRPKAPKKEKSVDEILAPVTEENAPPQTLLPEPSQEDWLNDENAPANLKNLPKPSDDADWLQDI